MVGDVVGVAMKLVLVVGNIVGPRVDVIRVVFLVSGVVGAKVGIIKVVFMVGDIVGVELGVSEIPESINSDGQYVGVLFKIDIVG